MEKISDVRNDTNHYANHDDDLTYAINIHSVSCRIGGDAGGGLEFPGFSEYDWLSEGLPIR